MSTQPSQPPYSAPVGQEAPYQVATDSPRSGGPGASWWIALAVIGIAALVGGYFIGATIEKNKYEPGKPAYDSIFNTGYAAGRGEGDYAGRKQGRKAGEAIGYQQGKSAGQQAGEIKGTADGASAALGGLTGWDPDSNYIVKVSPGPSSQVPFVISRRSEMNQDAAYWLCVGNPSRVCTGRVP